MVDGLTRICVAASSIDIHSGSIWLTEYGIPVTTVSAMMGHANPSFTLACYGRDPRDEQTIHRWRTCSPAKSACSSSV